VGLGLGDMSDVTLRGLRVIKGSKRVYLDMYTSILGVPTEQLEAEFGCKIIIADREMVESSSEEILEGANEYDVSFLVVGDPFG